MDEALKDKRFSHIAKDPRFRKVPKNLRKIKVDKRFAGMFDKNVFNDGSKQDERGRALDLEPAENLKKLYNTTNDSSEEEEQDTSTKASSKQSSQKGKISKASKGKLLKQNRKDEENEISKQDSEVSEDESQLKSKKKSLKKKESRTSSNKLKDSEVSEDESQLKSKKKFLKKKESRVSSNKLKDSSAKSSESEDSDPEDSKDLESKESEKSESEGSKDSESEEGKDSESEESEDSESEESDSGSIQGDFDHRWEEFDKEAETTEDITRRLAVCNMDWDRIRALDLFVVFNSFKLESGAISSVKIYPSEYGLKRMDEEKLKGPLELVEKTLASDEEEDLEDKKGAKYNQEKLRQYQINRLKYYYAIVECDTPETANHLYEQLNGLEYESSSVRFDLRFVPDDTTFDQEPTSVVDKSPDPTEYKPRNFVNTALQQDKPGLTWDETDPHRRETLQKAFTDLYSVEKDLKDYLASSSEESEGEVEVGEDGEKLSTEERIAKFRALLNLEEEEKKDEYEKEITWDPDVKEKTKQIVKEKLDTTSTPFDEILKKKKEHRQKKQKEKMKMNKEDKEISSDDSDLISDEESSKKSTKQLAELRLISDAKEIDTPQEKKKGKRFKKKKKEQKKEEFKCDVTDPRFSAIYTCHDYNIDPSDPHFKNTEGTQAIIKQKQKQRLHEKDLPEERKSKKMKYR